MDYVGLFLMVTAFFSTIIIMSYIEARNSYLAPPSATDAVRERGKFIQVLSTLFVTCQVFSIKLIGTFLNNIRFRGISYVIVLSVFLFLPFLDTNPAGNYAVFVHGLSRLTSSIFSIAWKDVSVLLAFFYFVYAQHKSASRARNFFSNRPALLFFTAFSIALMYNLLLKGSLYGKGHTQTAVNLCIMMYAASTMLFMWMFYDATKSLSVRLLLPYTINNWAYTLIRLYLRSFFPKITNNPARLFRLLNSYHESVYQLLEYCVKNNMRTVFLNNYTKWYTFMVKLNDRPFSKSKFNLDEIYKTLSSVYPKDYEFFYESILNSQARLISILFKEGEFSTAEKAIDQFFELPIPIEKNLCLVHYEVIRALCISIAKDHPTSLPKVYDFIHALASEYSLNTSKTYSNSLNNLFKALVNYSIYENDTNALSGIAYTIRKCSLTIDANRRPLTPPRNKYMQRVFIGQQAQLDTSAESQNDFTNVSINGLLLAALKSIELGQYGQTGFLVKFLVTGFSSDILNMRFENLTKTIDIHRDFSDGDIVLDFPFDESTILYCAQKLGLLIYGQQNYVSFRHIDFGYMPDDLLNTKIFNCNYIRYLIDKITVAANSYGLLFPKDDEFMKILREQLIVAGVTIQ